MGGWVFRKHFQKMSASVPQLRSLASHSQLAVTIPAVDAVVLEGSVLVNFIKPSKNQTFSKYAEETLFPFIKRYKNTSNTSHLDIVYNTYSTSSLKVMTREKRGTDLRREVNPTHL